MLFAFAADDQRDLGMHLETQQAVDHMDALALQSSGPFDVAFFVEARFQFHQHRYLLAVFDRLQQARPQSANCRPSYKASF